MKDKLIEFVTKKGTATGKAYIQFLVSVFFYLITIPFVMPVVKVIVCWTVWLWNYFNF